MFSQRGSLTHTHTHTTPGVIRPDAEQTTKPPPERYIYQDLHGSPIPPDLEL